MYVLFDDQAVALPAWLDDGSWKLDSITVGTSDVLRRVCYRAYDAGPSQLGGNATPYVGRREQL